MDPFVVVAFSKKVFRTRVVRHSLNPIFDERLFFHVRHSETGFQVQLTVLDWDKLSANDLVGDATFGVKEFIEDAPKPDGETGLYLVDDEECGVEKGMRAFRLELATVGDLPGGVKPAIRFRYVSLLFNFLRQLIHIVHPGHNTTLTTPCGSVSGDTTSPNTTPTILAPSPA
jgi:phosphatidylserine decarboxylase